MREAARLCCILGQGDKKKKNRGKDIVMVRGLGDVVRFPCLVFLCMLPLVWGRGQTAYLGTHGCI